MTPGEWIAFGALMLSVVGGGVGIAAFIVSQIAALGTRLAIIETRLDQALGSAPARRAHLRRVGGSG